jgi:non-ribosomal peptide synthetase component F
MVESGEGLAGSVMYSTDLFDDETIVRMLGHFETLLERVVAEPGERLTSLRMLSDDEVGGLAVQDFPDADLSQKDFETLFMNIGKAQSHE